MSRARVAWGLVLVLVGTIFLLESLAVIDLWAAGGWWPLLVAVGGILLVASDPTAGRRSFAGSRTAVLWARATEVRARPYRGGRVTAVLGHVTFDLRDTVPVDAGAEVTVRVVLGDVAITVPPGWRVRVEPRLLLAQLDEEILPAPADGPRLTIRGTVILGDLHVRTGSVVA